MDFEAELEKFQPSLDIEQAEDAILVDTSDIGLQESFDLLKRTILAHI